MRSSCTRRTPPVQHPWGRMVGCASCPRRRRLRRPGARPGPRGLRARRRSRDPRHRGYRHPGGLRAQRSDLRRRRGQRRLRHRAHGDVPRSAVGDRHPAHRHDRGDGTEVQDGAHAQMHFTLFNGETGEASTRPATTRRALQATVDEARLLPGLVKTLRCSTVGSRIVGVVPASAAFGDTGNADLGVEPGRARGLRARSGRRRPDAGRGRLEPAARRIPRGHLGRRRPADRDDPGCRPARRAEDRDRDHRQRRRGRRRRLRDRAVPGRQLDHRRGLRPELGQRRRRTSRPTASSSDSATPWSARRSAPASS